MKFINDGNFTKVGNLFVFGIGFCLIVAAQFFDIKSDLAKILSFTGFVLVHVGILASRAKAVGAKPFSNDPFGWRKIKESYKKKDDPTSGVDDKNPK